MEARSVLMNEDPDKKIYTDLIAELQAYLETPIALNAHNTELTREKKQLIKDKFLPNITQQSETLSALNATAHLTALRQIIISLQLTNAGLEAHQNGIHTSFEQNRQLGQSFLQAMYNGSLTQSRIHRLTIDTLKRINFALTLVTGIPQPEYTREQHLYMLINYVAFKLQQYQFSYVKIGREPEVPTPLSLTEEKLNFTHEARRMLRAISLTLETALPTNESEVLTSLQCILYALDNDNKALERKHKKAHATTYKEAREQKLGMLSTLWTYVSPQSTLQLAIENCFDNIKSFGLKQGITIPVITGEDRGMLSIAVLQRAERAARLNAPA